MMNKKLLHAFLVMMLGFGVSSAWAAAGSISDEIAEAEKENHEKVQAENRLKDEEAAKKVLDDLEAENAAKAARLESENAAKVARLEAEEKEKDRLEEAARLKEEEADRLAEEEAVQEAKEEAARLKAEEADRLAEEEAKEAAEEARLKDEQEKEEAKEEARLAEEQAARLKAEEKAKEAAEAARLKDEQEKEEAKEEARLAEEQAARLKAEEKAKEAAEAARLKDEQEKEEAKEAARLAEEQAKEAAEEARLKEEQEEKEAKSSTTIEDVGSDEEGTEGDDKSKNRLFLEPAEIQEEQKKATALLDKAKDDFTDKRFKELKELIARADRDSSVHLVLIIKADIEDALKAKEARLKDEEEEAHLEDDRLKEEARLKGKQSKATELLDKATADLTEEQLKELRDYIKEADIELSAVILELVENAVEYQSEQNIEDLKAKIEEAIKQLPKDKQQANRDQVGQYDELIGFNNLLELINEEIAKKEAPSKEDQDKLDALYERIEAIFLLKNIDEQQKDLIKIDKTEVEAAKELLSEFKFEKSDDILQSFESFILEYNKLNPAVTGSYSNLKIGSGVVIGSAAAFGLYRFYNAVLRARRQQRIDKVAKESNVVLIALGDEYSAFTRFSSECKDAIVSVFASAESVEIEESDSDSQE